MLRNERGSTIRVSKHNTAPPSLTNKGVGGRDALEIWREFNRVGMCGVRVILSIYIYFFKIIFIFIFISIKF